ncbi:hypothetical protein [Flavobacterium selenitireducens]|uniref:hypothetical protein n=1 Tax=Flavobacterium selenitireducens TaxID=2722704 RepID=UPI00168AFE46|nr:hypothetical protein [Flavobacterium selenitireducens]MBD3583571.1 hypothetical protein [Flavobacterium selenitireducens]
MKKLLFLLSFVFVSCSGDDSSDATSGSAAGKLRRYSYPTGFETYYYDNDGRISAYAEREYGSVIDSGVFVFSENKLTRIKHYENGIYRQGEDAVFEYEGTRITKRTSVESGITIERLYTYDNAGQLISDSQYDNGVLYATTNYNYANNGNISSISSTDGYQSGPITYDDKKNPFYYMMPESFAKAAPTSRNNILSEGNTIYSYQYNSQNFPVTATENGTNVSFEYY